MAIDPLRERLGSFFETNPEAEFTRGDEHSVVGKLWSDPTVEIVVEDDNDSLVETLNAIYLPPRFSAIWHRDTADIEFIWQTVPPDEEHRGRSFEFRYREKSYRCEFGDASPRLMAIARALDPTRSVGPTYFRNLLDLHFYQRALEEEEEDVEKVVPTSFWLRQVQGDENVLVDLARHLNFFMGYFDLDTPLIAIHQQTPVPGRRTRLVYPHGAFPAVVAGRPLDPYLLLLWESAGDAREPFRRFLYNYQIMEYAAFYYVQEQTRQTLRRVLSAPDTPSRMDEAVRQIQDAMSEGRMDDDARFNAVIRQVVDPEILWKQVEKDADLLSADIAFEGGFTVPALIKPGWGLEDFRAAWHPKLADSLRKLRNALVHAREARQAKGIAPTRANYSQLRPWARLLSLSAAQAVLYCEL